jgi:hypothetical protein
MSIKINNLRPTGSELLSDPETFMNELSGDELADVKGGLIIRTFPTRPCLTLCWPPRTIITLSF